MFHFPFLVLLAARFGASWGRYGPGKLRTIWARRGPLRVEMRVPGQKGTPKMVVSQGPCGGLRNPNREFHFFGILVLACCVLAACLPDAQAPTIVLMVG